MAGGTKLWLLSLALAGVPGFARADVSILERVLDLIAEAAPESLTGIAVNLAENLPSLTDTRLELAPEQAVIVGYLISGDPVYRTAGEAGVFVDQATAAQMVSGLAAGIYPVGSGLYSLPPAGQLSLWQQDSAGRALAEARGLVQSRIDGNIRMVATLSGIGDPGYGDLAAVAVTPEAQIAAGLRQRIDAVTLGAINSGTVLNGVHFGNGDPTAPIDLSSVRVGADMAVDAARTADATAEHIASRMPGEDSVYLAMNAAANAVAVNARVDVITQGFSGRIGDISTTVLGAVDNGILGFGRPATAN